MKSLSKTLKSWIVSHPINSDTAWYIQNLLGEYLGFDSKEYKEIAMILDKIIEGNGSNNK